MELRNQKFNGKVYGKAGNYSIYVNNQKINVSDAEVAEYNAYLQEYETMKANFPKVLESAKVAEIAYQNGWSRKMTELSLEEMKLQIENFKVDVYVKSNNSVEVTLQVASFNGDKLAAYLSASNGHKMFVSDLAQIENLIKQATNN